MLVSHRWLTLLGVVALSLSPVRSESPLQSLLLQTVQNAGFDQVIDFGPYNEACPGKSFCHQPAGRIAQPPNVDVAVLQLDANGQIIDEAEVLLSRDFPRGFLVQLDRNLGARNVTFLRWDIARSDGGTYSSETGDRMTTRGWTNNPALADSDLLVSGASPAEAPFMAPYPASLFKLMVAFHLLRMVDAHQIQLETPVAAAVQKGTGEFRPLRDWIDPMITASDNDATRTLLKLLHQRNRIADLNRTFQQLNLRTLQINGTSADGSSWQPGQIHMTAYDTARLLWILEAPPGTLWLDADRRPVTRDILSPASRQYLKQLLLDQGFNDALTTANFPGTPHVQPGIPSRVASRWIHPTNGTVQLDGLNYGVDIRPFNHLAAVLFAHKTGLTFNYASDAGIVTSLPGKPRRHYIVAFQANLGYRYADEAFAAATTPPWTNTLAPINYTQRIPAFGRALDEGLTRLAAARK
jgi:hypothetical protein